MDQHGVELDVLLKRYRDKAAAKRFFKRVVASCPNVPHTIVTDQLAIQQTVSFWPERELVEFDRKSFLQKISNEGGLMSFDGRGRCLGYRRLE